MFSQTRFRPFVALVVLLAIAFTTAPISAADFATPKAVIGSVSGVGPVELRGVAMSQEGTLFTGDRVSVGAKGYAKLMLVNGHKIELASSTNLTVAGTKQAVQLKVNGGNMAFTAKSSPLDVTAGNYQITGDRNVAGNVAFVGTGFVGLHITAGTASVRNLTTKEAVKVSAGQERLFSLQADGKEPLVQLASNALPGDPIPAVPPAPQGPRPATPPAKKGITRSGWVAILATIGGAAAAIAVLATRNETTVNATTVIQQQQATKTVAAAISTSQTAAATATAAATVATNATAAIAAAPVTATLTAAQRTTLQTQAQSLSAAAQATQQQIAQLQIQLQQLQTQLNGASGPQVTAIQNQINTVTNSLNSEVTNLNNEINSLNALVASAVASGVPNTPSVPVTIQPIPPTPISSASVPG